MNLRLLRGTLDQAFGGRGQIVMVAGEPGIGKTRIAQELARHAEEHGALVLWGRCHEEAGAPPYWPWVQIFREALGGADRRTVLADIGIGASDMADILPEIHDLAPGLEPSARLEDAAQARFRMFESIRQFIASLNSDRTVMLVLDDLHWADTPSLRLLEFLAPEFADNRLLLVGTYRANELSRRHPLSDTLGGLARVPHATRIHLGGLAADEVHEFIAAATGTRPPAWLASSLHTQTEGNPLFLREIVRFLEQQGVFRAPLSAIAAGDPHPRRREGGHRAAPQSAVGGLQRNACARLGDRPRLRARPADARRGEARRRQPAGRPGRRRRRACHRGDDRRTLSVHPQPDPDDAVRRTAHGTAPQPASRGRQGNRGAASRRRRRVAA